MVKYYCDRCGGEMPKPQLATDNSCQYHEFNREKDIRVHIAYRTFADPQQHICPWCLVQVLSEELGIIPQPKRRIE